MVDVIFKGSAIQTGFRVKIPKSVIDTLNMKVKDKIVIKFDPDKRTIRIEEDKEKK